MKSPVFSPYTVNLDRHEALVIPLKSEIIRIFIKGSAVAVMVLLLMFNGALAKFAWWEFDSQLAFRGPIPPKSPIVIISIDEDSFDELEFQWPWPRSVHAQLLNTLHQGQPAIIGMDLLFTEPSQLGVGDDEALGRAIEQAGNVVLAAALSRVDRSLYLKENLNPPIPTIRKHAAGFGPANLPLEADAFVRKAQPSFLYQKMPTPSFDSLIFDLAKNAGLTTATPPEDPFLINFRGGPQTFDTVSFYRVVNGELPPEFFQDKIVLIGATSPLLHDLYATPFASNGTMPGVELHANVLETMLQGISIQPISVFLLTLLTVAIGILGIWLAHNVSPFPGVTFLGMLVGCILLISHIGLSFAYLWVDPVPLLVTLVFGYSAATVESYVKERRERQRLSQYFSPSVLTDILRRPSTQRLHSQRRVVTVLFSDIRNFSAISEQLTPEENATFLRDYFTEVTEAVFQHGGMVDKYMGDATMALFNVPFDQPNHAGHALYAALDIQNRVATLSHHFQAQHGLDLACGIGIHTGEAIVGTMGSKQRFEYTAIGETINLGARLENLTKEFPANIIFSEATHLLIKDQFPTQHLGLASIKGKDTPIDIFTIRSAT